MPPASSAAPNLELLFDSGFLAAPAASIDTGAGGISQEFTHLLIVTQVRVTSINTGAAYRFNGDTGSNYTSMNTSAVSTGTSIGGGNNLFYLGRSDAPAGFFSSGQEWIPFYSNSAYEKKIVGVQDGWLNSTTYKMSSWTGYWTGTAPINQITLTATSNLVAGSRMMIYGAR